MPAAKLKLFRPLQASPCKECPFRRKAMPGWLGAASPESFVASVQSDAPLPCHLSIDYRKPDWKEKWLTRKVGKLCAGAAIFTRNIGKRPLPSSLLPIVKPNTELVFASPSEFLAHHNNAPVRSWELSGVKEGPQPKCCHFCERPFKKSEADEHFCYGCKTFICESCDTNDDFPCGPHAPEEHRR
jgi:hypothetical protein